MTSHLRSRASRVSAPALRSITTGLLLARSSGDEFAAGRGHVGDQSAGARGDDGAVAGRGEHARELDGAGVGGAGVEAGHDDRGR